MTKRVFRSIFLASLAVLLATLALILGALYTYFSDVQAEQLRLQTALAKLGAFALSLLAVLALLYGVNLAYCAATFGLGPLTRTIQSVPALMRCTMQITVGQYLFRFLLAKWAGAFVMGLWVMSITVM